jgi:hypothetical protein
MLLEPDLLDRIYQKWYHGSKRYENRWPKKYNSVHRNQLFEDWLWQQGFTVVQKDKKRYLKFSGPEKHLTFFLLKYDGR